LPYIYFLACAWQQLVNKLQQAGPSIIKIFFKHGCAWYSFLWSLFIHITMRCLTLRFKFNKVCKTKQICYDYSNVQW
jgi:hypothetical protein